MPPSSEGSMHPVPYYGVKGSLQNPARSQRAAPFCEAVCAHAAKGDAANEPATSPRDRYPQNGQGGQHVEVNVAAAASFTHTIVNRAIRLAVIGPPSRSAFGAGHQTQRTAFITV